MKRALWIGAAILVAVAAAVPLWLVLDDGGGRRVAAVTQTSAGDIGRLTIAGVNGGAAFGVQSFSWRPGQTAGGKTVPGKLQIVRGIDAVSPPLFLMGVKKTLAPSAKLELFQPGTKIVFASYAMTNVTLESYGDASSESIGLHYEGIVVTHTGEQTPAAPAADVVGRLSVPDLGKETVPITGFSFNFNAPVGTAAIDFQPVSLVRPIDGLAPALGRRAELGQQGQLTSVTIELLESATATAPYATYELSNVVVSSLADAWAAGEVPRQQLELSYAKITEKIGGATACHDVATGKLC